MTGCIRSTPRPCIRPKAFPLGGCARRRVSERNRRRRLLARRLKVAPQGRMRGELATAVRLRAQTVKKLHSCPIACVGATIGRPSTYRSNAFSGIVSCKANGRGRAMLAPTRVFRQPEPVYGQPPQSLPSSVTFGDSFPRWGSLLKIFVYSAQMCYNNFVANV